MKNLKTVALISFRYFAIILKQDELFNEKFWLKEEKIDKWAICFKKIAEIIIVSCFESFMYLVSF